MATRKKTKPAKKTTAPKKGTKPQAPAKKPIAKKTSKKSAKPAPKKAPAKKAPAKAAPKKAAPAAKAAPKKAAPAPKAAPTKAAPKKAAAKPAKAAPAAKKASKAAATYLGRADAMNASVSLLLVDGAAAADAWRGVDPDDIEAIEKMAEKMAELGKGLDSGKTTSFTLGKGKGVGFQLAVGKGIAHALRANGRVVIAEGFVDDVENPDFLGWVATPPAKDVAEAGSFEVKSGVLAMLLPGGSYEDLPSRIKGSLDEQKAARIGSETPGLLVKVAPGRYRLLVEPETTGKFGQAARAIVEPA